MASSLQIEHGLVSVHRLASSPAAVTGVLQPPFSRWLPLSHSCQFGPRLRTACAFALVDVFHAGSRDLSLCQR